MSKDVTGISKDLDEHVYSGSLNTQDRGSYMSALVSLIYKQVGGKVKM